MNYQQAVSYLNNTAWRSREPGLSRMKELLSRLGDPQNSLKFVHIAGTNGKGSCAAMIASVLKASGYKTGLFTSPYIYCFNERMQINGKQIDDDVLAGIVSEIQPAADAMDEHPIAFELMTAAALLWFARENCSIVVLEAGIGGTYDPTNIIESPEVSVIMNIGYDHMDLLGSTIEEIAENKAGIIKPGCSAVLYQQSDEVEELVRKRCEERGAALRISDFSAIEPEFDSLDGQVFSYKGESCAIPLLGEHQRKNTAVVIEAVEVLREKGWSVSQDQQEHGLYSVFWPARFEVAGEDPYFVIDGGHNPQCAGTVVRNLADYFPGMKHILLVGVLRDKDVDSIFKILNLAASEYVCVTPDNPRALPAAELAEKLRGYGKPVTVCETVEDGVFEAMDRAREQEGMVCAVGSLYITGSIRACLGLY